MFIVKSDHSNGDDYVENESGTKENVHSELSSNECLTEAIKVFAAKTDP